MIQQKMLVLLELLKFVCFIPLFSWRAMLFLLPALSLTFMSRDPQMMTFNFHYQDVPLAISYVSAIFGLASASQIKIWNVFSVSRKSQMIFTALLLFAIFNSKLFSKDLKIRLPEEKQLALYDEIQLLRKTLPVKGTIWTANSIGAYFFDRAELRCVIGWNQFFEDSNKKKYLILSDTQSPWPLSSQDYKLLIDKAELQVEKGLLEKLEFSNLRVYRTRNYSKNK